MHHDAHQSISAAQLYVGEVVFATVFGIVIGEQECGFGDITWNATPYCLVFTAYCSCIAGPSGANVFKPRDWGSTSDEVTNDITLEVTRIVLALGVFAVGVGE